MNNLKPMFEITSATINDWAPYAGYPQLSSRGTICTGHHKKGNEIDDGRR